VVIQFQLNPHDIAAQGILVLVCVSRRGERTSMKRILVVIENVILVKFFFGRHGGMYDV
jgi:hypothetical protein